MKRFILILSLLLAINLYAQNNVGIGNSSPAEKLDVTGNINVTGTIKANGVDGTANQVLMKNNEGILQWGSMGDFKNFASFYSSGTFIVPVNVTKIAVEIWGAGGGGNSNAGGGGGGYVYAELTVAPSQTGTITVGNGGLYATSSSASDGGASSIVINGFTINAFGGGGASWISAITNFTGSGGGFPMLIPGFKNYYGMAGTAGGLPKKTYQQFNATTFYETVEGGNGGVAYKAPLSAGQGSFILTNLATSNVLRYVGGNTDGSVPGGGGACGLAFAGGGETAGGLGGRGLVMVYY